MNKVCVVVNIMMLLSLSIYNWVKGERMEITIIRLTFCMFNQRLTRLFWNVDLFKRLIDMYYNIRGYQDCKY